MVKIFVKYSFFCLLVGIQACNFDNTYYDSPLSPEVVNKLVSINGALEASLHNTHSQNFRQRVEMRKRIEYSGNSHATSYLKIDEELMEKTKQVLSMLYSVKKRIAEKVADAKDNTNELKNPHNYQGLSILIKDDTVEIIKKMLDQYVSYLNKNFKDIVPQKFEPLTRDYKTSFLAKYTKDTTKISFKDYYFIHTPAVLVLTLLTEKQLDILDYERKCIEFMTPYVGRISDGFYEIVPIATDESSIVQEGEDYVARLYIAKIGERVGALMLVNGTRIPVDEKGIGQVRLKATGKGKQKWQGSITIQYKGRDTTFHIEKEYEVIPKLNNK